MSRVAALDLGSNTFLCLIIEAVPGAEPKVLADEVRTVRLSQDLDKTKSLHPQALERAEECLKEFRQLIDQYQVQEVAAVATSAARDAKNSVKLFEICQRYQIPVEIISGEREAQTSFLGGTFGHLKKEENILVIDIGGGSTELILGNSEKILFAQSQDVGAVRMTERHISQQPVLSEDHSKLQQDLMLRLEPTVHQLKKLRIDRVLAVAGTPTTIATLENNGKFSVAEIDGKILDLGQLTTWQKIFSETSVDEKKMRYQLAGRADIIFAGVSILIWILKALGQEKVYVSTKGVRYGLALHLLSKSSPR